LAALRAAEVLPAPIALTVHLLPSAVAAYVPTALGSSVTAALWAYEKWLIAKCAAPIAPSHFAASVVQARTGRRPHVISNGIDLGRYCPSPAGAGEAESLRRKYGLLAGSPIILYVGRLDVEKRIDVLVRAAALAMPAANAQLLIAGDGTQRHAATKLCQQLGLEQRCRFVGYVSAGDVPALFRLASVFATASPEETQGLAVLEAAASGVPVVCPRSSAFGELVADGLNGFLVPPGDVEAMGERLAWLLCNPAGARRMGLAGRALAQAHAIELTWEAHEDLYGAMLATARPNGREIRP
jgi:glycosyltransferase involved in cell wall biosynthesis